MTPRWRVAAVVLTVVLAAVACTTGRGGTRPPATANGSPIDGLARVR
jgi:hypothetical protein